MKFSHQNVRCRVQLRQRDEGIALIEGHGGAGNVRIRAHSFLQGGMASSQWVFLGAQSRQIFFSKQGKARSGNRTSKSSRAGKSHGRMKTQHKDSGAGAGAGLGQNQWHHLSDIYDIAVVIFICVCILPRMMSSNFPIDPELNETLLWLEQVFFGPQLRQFSWHFFVFSSLVSDKRRLFQRKCHFHLENGVFVEGGEERFFSPWHLSKVSTFFPTENSLLKLLCLLESHGLTQTWVSWKSRRQRRLSLPCHTIFEHSKFIGILRGEKRNQVKGIYSYLSY